MLRLIELHFIQESVLNVQIWPTHTSCWEVIQLFSLTNLDQVPKCHFSSFFFQWQRCERDGGPFRQLMPSNLVSLASMLLLVIDLVNWFYSPLVLLNCKSNQFHDREFDARCCVSFARSSKSSKEFKFWICLFCENGDPKSSHTWWQ